VYLSTIGRPKSGAGAATGRRFTRVGGFVSGNVVALGAVSLITDISAEMVTAILPMYLVLGLHLSPFA
jgi:hypothetical protein